MIESSEFPMQFDRGLIVGKRGILCGCEVPEPMTDSVSLNGGPKRSSLFSLIKRDTLVAGCVIGAHLGVHLVLGVSCKPKIRSSIIESIHVDVVDLQVVRGTHNKSRHRKMKSFSINDSDSFHMVSISASAIPLPLIEPVEIGIINDSKLSPGQRDFPHDPILSEDGQAPRRD